MKKSPPQRSRLSLVPVFIVILVATIGLQACENEQNKEISSIAYHQVSLQNISPPIQAPKPFRIAVESESGKEIIKATKAEAAKFNWVEDKDVLALYLSKYTNFDDPSSIEIYPSSIEISKLAVYFDNRHEAYLSGQGYDHNIDKLIYTRVKLEKESNAYFLPQVRDKEALHEIYRDISYCSSSDGSKPCQGFNFIEFEVKGELVMNVSCQSDCDHSFEAFGSNL